MIAAIVAAYDFGSFRKKEMNLSKRHWLEEYDAIGRADWKTIDWISTFGAEKINRAAEMLEERTIGEEMATNVLYGAIGKLGLLAAIGVIYTQLDTLFSSNTSPVATGLRIGLAAAIGVLYISSWPDSLRQVKRERLRLILKFSLRRAELMAASDGVAKPPTDQEPLL